MRRLAALPLFLIMLFALAISLSLWAGRSQPTPEPITRLHLADCALPCWNDITLGVSTGNDVINRMSSSLPHFVTAASTSPFLSWQYDDTSKDDTSINVAFDYSHQAAVALLVNIRTDFAAQVMPNLGEMLTVFGAPTCAAVNTESSDVTLGYENAAHQMILQFTTYQPSLSSPVKSMLIGLSKTFTCQKGAMPWHEFRHSQYSSLYAS